VLQVEQHTHTRTHPPRAQVAALHQIAASSGTAHGYEAARLLDLMASRHVALSVSGYVFFGSSLALSARVEEVRVLAGPLSHCVMLLCWGC